MDPGAADQAGLPIPGHRPARLRKDFSLILLGGIILLLLVALAPALPFLQPLRLVLGFAYVLVVPGYCLAAALFPRRADLDDVERTGLSLGLSIAWVPVLAFILDRLPWRLRPWPIVLGEMASILLFMAVALWRGARQPPGMAYAPHLDARPGLWWQSLPTAEKHLYRFAAAALLLSGLALASIFLLPAPDEFMTEFYMLGPEGLAENYPQEVRVGEDLGVTLGIANHEPDARSYRVEIWAVDPWAEDRRALVAQAGPLDLAREESIQWPITWRMPWSGSDQIVDLLLYSGPNKQPPSSLQSLVMGLAQLLQGNSDEMPYRSLRLWINVGE